MLRRIQRIKDDKQVYFTDGNNRLSGAEVYRTERGVFSLRDAEVSESQAIFKFILRHR